MTFHGTHSTVRSLLIGLLIFNCFSRLPAAHWDPVPAEDLADTKPLVDPEAGAEILLRKVSIHHVAVDELYRHHFVRAKIYSVRGIEEFINIQLPYNKKNSIRDIDVRTIKPNGEIIELTRADIYDREILKTGKERVRVKSFSPAGLEPGAIVEYSFAEIYHAWPWYVSMSFQTSLPARVVQYRFRPIDFNELAYTDARRLSSRALAFNCPLPVLKADTDGAFPFEMRNVPAAKEEPFAPPSINAESSVIICYSLDRSQTPAEYWDNQSKDLHKRMIKQTKATNLVRTTLAGIVADSDRDAEKLRKIYAFCTGKIRNRHSGSADFTSREREKFKDNESANDVLKAGHGTGIDINMTFVALARAAGLDARYVAAGNRDAFLFDPSITEPFMADDLIAAVQLDGKWTYFDPGASYLPFGLLHWRNTVTGAIIAQPKNAKIESIPATPATDSGIVRKAELTLAVDGTLEGEVTFDYTGHRANAERVSLAPKTASEREDMVREEIQTTLKLAEISDLKVENLQDTAQPLKVTFHLRVPEYAERTGSRLFVQPAVFQKNEPPQFAEKKRRTQLMFRYCFIDQDIIRIAPPEGYELEEASSPGSLALGALGAYQASLGVSKRNGTLVYQRSLAIRAISIPLESYPAVNVAFDIIHKRDAHTLTLRRKSEAADAPTETTASTKSTVAPSTDALASSR